jgi:hypothetical protein
MQDQYEKNRHWLKLQQEINALEQRRQTIETRILLAVSCILVFAVFVTLTVMP